MPSSERNDKPCFLTGERVEVLLPRPFDHGFDYRVGEAMQLHLGDYVLVPFGPRDMLGVVWGEGTQDVAEDKCKSIKQHLTHVPAMKVATRRFIDWVADYTLSATGQVLKMAIPIPDAALKPATQIFFRLVSSDAKLTPARERVAQYLTQHENAPKARLLEHCEVSAGILSGMVKAGMLVKEEVIAQEAPDIFHPSPAPALRQEQQAAVTAIEQQLEQGFRTTVLEGVTGSGKTEVYFAAIEQLLKQHSGQILVLLPEIALAVQWMQRFERRFGAIATLWHSSVSESHRKCAWRRISNGSARLVVGARSALFLPYHDLKLIVVDEEHEASYKQEEGVLYHARDMAVARAKMDNIPCVLCSATPSLESVFNVQQGKYHHLQLRERHGEYHEPSPHLIDIREHKPESGSWISPPLRAALLQNLSAGHQSMLFLNRRGYAPLLLCRSCGHRFDCDHCSAWMVQHQRPPRLQCHHCDRTLPMPTHCPECGSDELVACGPGVERIGEEVANLMPEARRVILSSDEGELGAQIEAILRGDIDIIIGTQMVAKGHHFPNLALVGVVDADIGLNGGDLRASERTYQLMHQLAGRAGRELVEGRVLLQTAQPEHPLMQALAEGDKDAFMQREMAMRQEAGWPPFGRLASLLIDGFDEVKVKQAGMALMQTAPRYDGITYLGPAPAPMARARNRYRYRILVKAPRNTGLQKILREWTGKVKLSSAVRLKIDIDPYQFM